MSGWANVGLAVLSALAAVAISWATTSATTTADLRNLHAAHENLATRFEAAHVEGLAAHVEATDRSVGVLSASVRDTESRLWNLQGEKCLAKER
jgi:hypothetical protein